MDKRIFDEQPVTEENYRPKQTFEPSAVIIEPEEQETIDEPIIEQMFKPSRFWLRLFLACLGLFALAVVAQSVQWLIDSWQDHRWIELAFALVFFGISVAGIGALGSEWRKLVRLRQHYYQQQQSEQLLFASPQSGEKAVELGKTVLARLHSPHTEQAGKRWLSQLDEAYHSQEVLYLFSQNVLLPIDEQVKKLISKSAVENAMIVGISPLAVVDVLMVAWRNIALVNKITRAYGMELGYISRLKLFKMVLTNMVFAGATEIVTDLGSEFFAQNLSAKFSMRAAQGIGVGLLTARLGIKAMEFCRPVVFAKNERPSLSVVRQALLGAVKDQMFSKSKEAERVKVD